MDPRQPIVQRYTSEYALHFSDSYFGPFTENLSAL